MPLLVRLTDSQVQLADTMFAKISDRVEHGWCVWEEVSAARLAID